MWRKSRGIDLADVTAELPDDWRDRLRRVLLAELLGLLAAVGLSLGTGHPGLLPAAACLVVGAHFLPLAKVFDQRQFRWTGFALAAGAHLTTRA